MRKMLTLSSKYVRSIDESREFDLVAVLSRLHDMRPVQASLQVAFEALPTAELGLLDPLPAELTYVDGPPRA